MDKRIKNLSIILVIVILCAIFCVGLLIKSSGKKESEAESTQSEITNQEETKKADEIGGEKTEEELQAIADEELERFYRTYGLTIDEEEMIKQVRIRALYEQQYGTSYELEEVFLATEVADLSVGDEGADEVFEMLDEIDAYLEIYGVDESRYKGMSIMEELTALRVEFGPLDEEVLEEYLNPKKEEKTEQEIADDKIRAILGDEAFENEGNEEE